jgi:hypothetical protein
MLKISKSENSAVKSALLGAVAGAAGTTALNAVTYGDMATRGRPASQTPAKVIERVAQKGGLTVDGADKTRHNRESGFGALSGIAIGVGMGAAYGLLNARRRQVPVWLGSILAGTGAMAPSDVPATGLGVTSPQDWRIADWASDIAPHLTYGVVTAGVFRALNNNGK